MFRSIDGRIPGNFGALNLPRRWEGVDSSGAWSAGVLADLYLNRLTTAPCHA
ncbi:hypothetical protein [Streptosporangium roseum]|uniref:hypothetical protein n=1 Tax=Streptosporangium roseum TaxID=2001 RepID=UPI0012DFB594|nr:hypothetical protein [Streptosporangium roseum]